MKISSSEPGVYLSAAAHAALLVAALVSFSGTPRPMDAAEAIPVEMITDSQFNEVMKGVRDAPKPAPPVADKVSEVVETKPRPVRNEAKADVPAPPSPLKRQPDPGEDEKPEPPTPPVRTAALPPEPEPPKPEPPKPPEPPTPPVRPPEPRVEKPEPPKPEPKPEPRQEPKPEKAEAIEPPRPPVRPKPEPAKPEPPKQAEVKPTPPPRPAPPAPQKPKPEPMKASEIAALLAEKKTAEPKPAVRPKSGQESAEKARTFDPNGISKLLSKEEPAQRASTGRAVSQVASLGAPNASAQRMSPSLWGQLDGYLVEQYKRCWNYLPTGVGGSAYVPQIEVAFTESGLLSREPRLRNPPSDPALRALADSALRAVKNPLCNPMRIPAQFQPYYNEWKERILRFDPDEMMG
ncbi:MAG: Cell division and transport-associated protein TolA [Hyphomicrobiales bacterium]|nr:Cell division and transport-associated protein TolA [Hyphomicrobiales bacterium]